MKLDIVIPTLNRREKLDVCVNSILKTAKEDMNLYLYFGDEQERQDYEKLFQGITNIHSLYLDNYKVPTFWNGYLKDMKADALMYLNDDVELYDDTLDVVVEDFMREFPDTDGVLGLNQVNIADPRKVESAFGVIGTKYADRFPNRQVWCPDYHRFYGDWELWKYAKDIGKFYFSEVARVNHYHPCTDKKLEDSTHYNVRTFLKEDKVTFQRRQIFNLLWGKNFSLINE